jgi:hypothetical protein
MKIEPSRFKPSVSRDSRTGHRARRLALYNAVSGDLIGTFATVPDAVAAHREFQQGQKTYVPTIVKEAL